MPSVDFETVASFHQIYADSLDNISDNIHKKVPFARVEALGVR
jgi:hypothetical protein